MTWQPNLYQHGHLVVVVAGPALGRAGPVGAAALGYADQGHAGETYRSVLPDDGPGVEILLQRTGDPKQGKNRLHLDLRTRDLEAEVSRVLELGATRLTQDPVEEHGWAWHILADPDGNEFCVLRPPAGYWTNPEG